MIRGFTILHTRSGRVVGRQMAVGRKSEQRYSRAKFNLYLWCDGGAGENKHKADRRLEANETKVR